MGKQTIYLTILIFELFFLVASGENSPNLSTEKTINPISIQIDETLHAERRAPREVNIDWSNVERSEKAYWCDYDYYYDDTATVVNVWPIPDAYGDDLFNTRFTVDNSIAACTLKVAWIMMYGGYMTGTPDMRIYLWDDDGFGFPGNKLDSSDIPYSSLPTGFGYVSADWSDKNWVFTSGQEYHIGWTTLGWDGDTLCCVSDKATGPHVGERRSSENWNGIWGSILDDWGTDYTFFMESERCCHDNFPLVVLNSAPLINSAGNHNYINIEATFDTTMNSLLFNHSTFIVHASQTGLHSGTFSYDEVTYTVTFDPDEDFAPGEVVTVTLTNGIESTGGIPLKPYSWSFTIVAETAPAEFDIVEQLTSGLYAHDVVTVDLDSDNDLDMVVCNEADDEISVFINGGNGYFTLSNKYTAGDLPLRTGTGDFDRDGDIDLAVTNANSNNFSIFFNDGSGQFSPRVDYGALTHPRNIECGDIDNDGDIDIVVENTGGSSLVLFANDGNGVYAERTTIGTTSEPESVELVDLDNDGDKDIGVVHWGTNTLGIFLNQGGFNFSTQTTYTVGDNPRDIKAFDFDGDYDLDIATVNSGSNDITLLTNDGSGLFSVNPTAYPVGIHPIAASSGDIDGDGDIDMVVVNDSTDNATILFFDGLGNVEADLFVAIGDGPHGVAMADLDSDGDLDFVTAHWRSDNIQILFNEICTDTDGDHFGDPGYPENTCALDNCPSIFNPLQEDYDLDGIGDSCDPCNNFMFDLTKFDTLAIRVTEPMSYYPEVTDPDDTEFSIIYDIIPSWATVVNDSLTGTPPGDTIVYFDTVSYQIMDACNVDSLSFTTMAFLCGNFNGDHRLNILDITYLISYLYAGGPEPNPLIAADVNDDNAVNILDITYLIAYLYSGGLAPVCQ